MNFEDERYFLTASLRTGVFRLKGNGFSRFTPEKGFLTLDRAASCSATAELVLRR